MSPALEPSSESHERRGPRQHWVLDPDRIPTGPPPTIEPPSDCERLSSLDQLLTEEERNALHDDLAEMARLRRRAEVDSAHLRIGQ